MGLKDDPFLIATIIQTFLYALYLVSLAHALRWLLYEEEGWKLKSRSDVNWLMLAVTVLVFVLSTVDIVVALTILITFHDFHSTTTQHLVITSLVAESTAMTTIDAVLIFRCWMVYQRSWRVICYPAILWMGNLVCMFLWISSYTMAVRQPVPYVLVSVLSLDVFYSSNFAMNLYATSAIVYRVWRVARANNHRSSVLYRVCRIVAGTGILYTCTSLPLVVTVFLMAKHFPAYLICDGINFSVAGIAFNLLLIRVGQLRAEIEIDICCEGTDDVAGSILLSTVQFNLPSVASDERTLDSVMNRRHRIDANHQKKGTASS